MNDLIMIVIRFLLYLDLMVIFGLPFFQIYGISGVRHETYNLTNFRSFITFAVVTGIILTGINMLLVSNAMSGVTDLRELSIHVIEMVEELKRLSRMTSDMLFLARSEHGLLRLDKHDVDLAAELNELRELFEPLADETGKTITVEGEGVVAGDSDMLRRAFSNLLSNAIKYSPDNTCTAIHIERDSDCVNVMITNTMSGQVPANLERLFDRFYRADSSRFYNTEGAGLGLSITRSIIHAHGGELSAEQQGREIVFSVRLLMD
ncbi:copper resistant sensor kinase PcoS [Klebsiella pneumoniae]|nr:copper resistant sensor kinase PcoS [Klebsiella pneumoniae]